MVGVGRDMQYKCKIVENLKLCEDVYEMIIEGPQIAKEAKPGQFLHIKVNRGFGVLLRRPFSISRIYRDEGNLSLIYQVIGKGTSEMTSFKKNEYLDVMGPLGNGFPLIYGKRCAVIGGGMGIAPLVELASSLKGCDAYLGFRNNTFKLTEFGKVCKELFVATEDGSMGSKGYVTDLIKDIKKYDIVYTCGPKSMMKKVKELCEASSVRCFVSIEERMGCGIGACLVCACKIKEGETWHYRKVCTDGPVFEAGEVDFDD